MNILSCEKLTIEQATKLNLDSTADQDECLFESIENYKRGFIEPSEFSIESLKELYKLSKEYQTVYEKMGMDEVRYSNLTVLTKSDMFRLWEETQTQYENEKIRCCRKSYTTEDFEEDLNYNDIFIMKTDEHPFLLVTDIGDAIIVSCLDSNMTAYDASLSNEDYETIKLAIVHWHEKKMNPEFGIPLKKN